MLGLLSAIFPNEPAEMYGSNVVICSYIFRRSDAASLASGRFVPEYLPTRLYCSVIPRLVSWLVDDTDTTIAITLRHLPETHERTRSYFFEIVGSATIDNWAERPFVGVEAKPHERNEVAAFLDALFRLGAEFSMYASPGVVRVLHADRDGAVWFGGDSNAVAHAHQLVSEIRQTAARYTV